ncbi:MAG: hypothetical protein JWQ97_3116 [Phenylobacterium sp.]|nr:hypothetical protein [Phenylobacterium sp.]
MSQPKCPICGRPTDPAARPFCSKRCADLDLLRWLTGRYVAPGREDDERPSEGGSDWGSDDD